MGVEKRDENTLKLYLFQEHVGLRWKVLQPCNITFIDCVLLSNSSDTAKLAEL